MGSGIATAINIDTNNSRFIPGGGGTGDPRPNELPPSNLTIQRYPALSPGGFGGSGTQAALPTAFIVTMYPPRTVTSSIFATVRYRLYYISANEQFQTMGVTPNGVVTQRMPSQAGPHHWVQDVAASNQPVVVTVAAAPYLVGGWFYAVGLDSNGTESTTSTAVVPLPIAQYVGVPTKEVTSPAISLTQYISGSHQYANVKATWTSDATQTGTVAAIGTAYVQLYINNFANNGLLWEGPYFSAPASANTTGTGTFVLETDRGAGGFPDPGSHNVTFYFVSVSQAGVRRPDPTSAPSVVVSGGITV